MTKIFMILEILIFNDYSLVIEYLKKNNSIIKLGETFPEENFNTLEGSFFIEGF